MYNISSVRYPREFVLGTQYYRQPTPLPAEWDADLKNIRDMGIEYIQLRPHWRWHERSEGVYAWDDIDMIFDLASRIGLKIIFKFMLECGPEYLFKKYNGYRVGLKGEKIWPITHGAFYPGGWIPCFDNPYVNERMRLFISQAVNRYKNDSSLSIWHAWNEPRSRPVGECTCEHSHRNYIEWLRTRFGSIETLNTTYGQCWADFEDIDIPRNTAGFFDMHLWRQWAASRVAWRVGEVVRAIKESDPSRDVIAHVGMSSVVQDTLHDTSDDWLTRREVAFYGSSFEIRYTPSPLDKSWPFMIADWMRGVSGNGYFWINELYPSRSRWQPELSPETIVSWAWSAVACGAKGIVLWQYRKERVGCETNEAGLVESDGCENSTSQAMRGFFKTLMENQQLFLDASVPKAEIAIVYDFNSDLLNRIEESNNQGNLELVHDLPVGYTYKTALQGIYHLFWQTGLSVDFISSHDIERIHTYKMVYLPYMVMLDESQVRQFSDYVENGGYLLAEGGVGMREANTWVSTARPCGKLKKVFGLREIDRVMDAGEVKTVNLPGLGCVESKFMNAIIRNDSAEVAANYTDGNAAVCENRFGKGIAVMTGFSAGLANMLQPDGLWRAWLLNTAAKTGVTDAPAPNEKLYIRKMQTDKQSIYFIFNHSDDKAAWQSPCKCRNIATEVLYQQNEDIEIPPKNVVVIENNRTINSF